MITQPSTNFATNPPGGIPSNSRELIVEPTRNTPFLKFSKQEKIFMIKGSSMRENMHHFYQPYLRKLWGALNEHDDFKLCFYFREINATTAKVLFDIFKAASYKKQAGTTLEIYWGVNSESDDMYQIGKDLSEIYGIELKYMIIESEIAA